jgi:hypothetical protein
LTEKEINSKFGLKLTNMKKILLAAAVFAMLGSSAYAGNGNKDKKAKAGKECVKTEKKSCCAGKEACKKPATAPDSKK